MAGILAAVGWEVRVDALMSAARLLCHGPEFEVCCYTAGRLGALAVAYRKDDPPSDVWLPDAGLGVVVYGQALDPGRHGTRMDAAGVARRYRTSGLDAVCDLDGAFVIAVLDQSRRQLHLVNDRTGTLPVKYRADPGRFVAAPEAKAIHAVLATKPVWDRDGMLAFLLTGHGLGWGTLFRGIRLLGPARACSVELDSARFQERNYWALRFRPERRLREADAASRLHEALLRSHAAALSDKPHRFQLLMTGGYDSRAVLACLSELERLPSECLTWGVDDSLPLSDPLLAGEMAAACGVPWRFLQYDADHFGEHLRRWAAISEVESDNLGNYAAGPDFLSRGGAVAPAVVNGDQLLGTGGLPLDAADAYESLVGVRPGEVGSSLTGMLRPDVVREAATRVWTRAEEAMGGCLGSSAKDIQDHLNLNVRLARWLNAPAYFREPMVSSRRPMLLRPLLDLFETLPEALRVEKRVLVAMLRRYHPRMLEFPKASAHSLVDWARSFTDPAGSAGRAIRSLLDPEEVLSLPIGSWLEADALKAAREDWLGRVTTPVDRTPRPERVLGGLRRVCGRSQLSGRLLRRVEHGARRFLGRRSGPGRGTVLARLGLLVALQREMGREWFRPGVVPNRQRTEAANVWPGGGDG